MDSAQIMNIISLIILLILSSLFSCSETAFLSVSKIKIRTLAEEGNKKAKLVESLLDDQDRLLSAILVGNNLVISVLRHLQQQRLWLFLEMVHKQLQSQQVL